MADAQLKAVITAEDRASKVISQVGSSLETVQSKLKSMQPVFTKMAAAGTAGLGVLGLLGKSALNAAADYEQSRIAFATMLGSATKAEQFLKELTAFAKRTPFELPGLEQAAKQLLAYGITQQEVLPNLKALGDIAAGVGMDKLPNLIMAFGQVSAATRLTGMELRQFTEAGVPLLDQLAKQMNKPVSEIQKMVSEGKIGFAEVQKALVSLTSEGGRFENMMDKQSKSFTGMMSNLKDSWGIFMREQGEKILPWAKDVTERLQGVLAKIADWISQNPELARTLLIVTAGILGVVTIVGTLGLVLPAIITGFTLLGTAILFVASNPIVLLIAALALMILKVKQAMDEVGGAKEFFRQTWDGIKIIFKEAIDSIISYFQPLLNKISEIESSFISLRNKISSFNPVNIGMNLGSSLFGRASGGSVSPNRPFIVGEHGPELFTPQTYGMISNGGGSGITINLYGNTFMGREGIAEQIGNDIMRALKRNVKL